MCVSILCAGRSADERCSRTVNVGDDCPVFDGLFEYCSISAGGSMGQSEMLPLIQVMIIAFCLDRGSCEAIEG